MWKCKNCDNESGEFYAYGTIVYYYDEDNNLTGTDNDNRREDEMFCSDCGEIVEEDK